LLGYEKGVRDVRTYLLVHAEVGRAAQVARAIEADGRVLSADTVTGAYDVIAQVAVGGSQEVSELSDQVRALPGVTRLIACLVETNASLWDEILIPEVVGA